MRSSSSGSSARTGARRGVPLPLIARPGMRKNHSNQITSVAPRNAHKRGISANIARATNSPRRVRPRGFSASTELIAALTGRVLRRSAILVRWHSDFMSAPHTYVTDRPVLRHLRWWVNSGENFEPENTVPVPARASCAAWRTLRTMTAWGRTAKSPRSFASSARASRVQTRRSEQAASAGALED